MQTLHVPKYGLYYRVNPKNPCELLWSKKPFGPATMWQHAFTFGKPIRALDIDDATQQGVAVLNDSSTFIGSGVRKWGHKYYTAGSRIYSLYAVGESMMKNKMKVRVHEAEEFSKEVATGLSYDDACFLQEEMSEFAESDYPQVKVRVRNDGSDNFSVIVKSTDESDLERLPDSFGLDDALAELNTGVAAKTSEEPDDSPKIFSDEYLDNYVKSLKGTEWDIRKSDAVCDELHAYIDAINEGDNGNDILYIKNDEEGFEMEVIIEYSTDTDHVADATWKRT